MFNYIFFLQTDNNHQTQSWVKLLLNEAFSNYMVFGLGIIVGIFGWIIVRYLSRTRPRCANRIVEIDYIAQL